MKSIKVKEMMVPIADYATVSETATLYEAVLALEAAQRTVLGERDRHRAILVFNGNNQIVGKVNMWDVLKGIEPGYRELGYPREDPGSSYGRAMIRHMLETYGLWRKSMDEICSLGGDMKVTDIMHIPEDDEYIDEEAFLDEAIHQLLSGYRQSLLVTRGDDLVGVLRMTDIFFEICNRVRNCRS